MNERTRAVLKAMSKSPDGLTVKQVCSVTGHKWGNHFLKTLWERGLVEPFETEGPEVWTITDEGRNALKAG